MSNLIDGVPTIYAVNCPFNKRGFPVVGSFGSSVRGVVIIPIETWTKLAKDIPELARMEFNVGSLGSDGAGERS